MAFPHESIETPPRAASPVHKFGTSAVHAGSPHDPVTGAVIESVRNLEAFAFYSTISDTRPDLPVHHLCPDQRWQTRWFIRVH